jgi:hypothetical protein
MMKPFLNKFGLKPILAGSGSEAGRAIERYQPRVVVLLFRPRSLEEDAEALRSAQNWWSWRQSQLFAGRKAIFIIQANPMEIVKLLLQAESGPAGCQVVSSERELMNRLQKALRVSLA